MRGDQITGKELRQRIATQPRVADVTKVASTLRAEASRLPFVESVYLRPDGLEFVMTGTDSSPEHYEAGAAVASRLQRQLGKRFFVEGGWFYDHDPIENWIVAYVRGRE